MMKKLNFAKMFTNSGISVIPLQHRGKNPEASMLPTVIDAETGNPSRSWEPFKTQLPTEYQVECWLHSDWQNYGVVAGWKNLAILDFDDMAAFSMWLDWYTLLNKHIEIYPMPYIVRSSRGAHVYVSCPTLEANEKRRGVDLKCHGYVVGPGCTHPSGTEYEPITPFVLIDVFSLDTILPIDLFPKIAPSPSCNDLGALQVALSPVDFGLKSENYDPLQMAMFGGTDLITTVKSRIRIETMFSSVRRTSADGRWYVTLCPFHDDHNPSMWIDTRRQICGCNTCGFRPMDAINLYARSHGLSESDAVSAMARELGVWG